MVINIEQAQNGFVVRDSSDGGTNPILINDFNALINVLVQAFKVKLQTADGDDVDGETTVSVNKLEVPETDDDDESTDDA
jgi:hypothetical protein